MKKFTEGKWEVASDGCIEVDSETGLTHGIAEVMNFYTAEGEANARLIAAAPEMYDLLYEALQELKGYNPIENGISTIYPDIEELLYSIDGTEV